MESLRLIKGLVYVICLHVPWSGTGQNGTVQQGEGQGAVSAHGQDDGVQGGQDVALGVVGLQGLRQLRE